MPSPFSSIGDLIEDLMKSHVDNGNQHVINEIDARLAAVAKTSELEPLAHKSDLAALADQIAAISAKLDTPPSTPPSTIEADLLAIKVFLGIPDLRIGATQEQVDALGAKISTATEGVKASEAAITSSDSMLIPPANI